MDSQRSAGAPEGAGFPQASSQQPYYYAAAGPQALPQHGLAQLTAAPQRRGGGWRPGRSGSGAAPKKHCNCKNSRCLKLYCECFASGRYCDGCNCCNCCNNKESESTRKAAVESILERNPNAFRPKIQGGTTEDGTAALVGARHNKGCNCKKSGCLKKYCECFQAGISCSDNCKCLDCKNFEGSEARDALLATIDTGRAPSPTGRKRNSGAAARKAQPATSAAQPGAGAQRQAPPPAAVPAMQQQMHPQQAHPQLSRSQVSPSRLSQLQQPGAGSDLLRTQQLAMAAAAAAGSLPMLDPALAPGAGAGLLPHTQPLLLPPQMQQALLPPEQQLLQLQQQQQAAGAARQAVAEVVGEMARKGGIAEMARLLCLVAQEQDQRQPPGGGTGGQPTAAAARGGDEAMAGAEASNNAAASGRQQQQQAGGLAGTQQSTGSGDGEGAHPSGVYERQERAVMGELQSVLLHLAATVNKKLQVGGGGGGGGAPASSSQAATAASMAASLLLPTTTASAAAGVADREGGVGGMAAPGLSSSLICLAPSAAMQPLQPLMLPLAAGDSGGLGAGGGAGDGSQQGMQPLLLQPGQTISPEALQQLLAAVQGGGQGGNQPLHVVQGSGAPDSQQQYAVLVPQQQLAAQQQGLGLGQQLQLPQPDLQAGQHMGIAMGADVAMGPADPTAGPPMT